MKILYIEDDQDIHEIFSMKFNALTGAEIVAAYSIKSAKEHLQKLDEYSLVVSDHNLLDGTGVEIGLMINELNPNIPFIIFSGDRPSVENGLISFLGKDTNYFVEKPPADLEFEEAIQLALGENKEYQDTKNSEEFLKGYVAIKSKYFNELEKADCAVYIQLSDSKYVRIINDDCPSVNDIIEKYIEKGHDYLHIMKKDYEHFSNSLVELIIKKLEMAPQQTKEIALALQLDATQIVHEKIKQCGICEKVIDLARATIDSTLKSINEIPKLSQIMRKINKRGNYIYEHSLIVAHIACAIIRNADWDRKEIRERVTFAAMMHDSLLKDHELARDLDIDPNLLKELPNEKREVFMRHGLKMADLLREMKGIPNGTDLLVLHHHERPDGKGFPVGIKGERIPLISATFITSHEYVTQLYRHDFDEDKQPIILEQMEEFCQEKPNFVKALDSLKEVL